MVSDTPRPEMREEDQHAGRGPDHDLPATVAYQPASEELLRAIRERLPQKEAKIFDQRASGLTWTDISRACGESADVLRMQLTRTVARIKRQLQLEGSEHEP
jgi:DNA-directed RNA polymerase specialized sigma24 family protein